MLLYANLQLMLLLHMYGIRIRCLKTNASGLASNGIPFEESRAQDAYRVALLVSAEKQNTDLREHLPCNPAAETALYPVTWCSKSLPFCAFSSPECLVSQTPVSRLIRFVEQTCASGILKKPRSAGGSVSGASTRATRRRSSRSRPWRCSSLRRRSPRPALPSPVSGGWMGSRDAMQYDTTLYDTICYDLGLYVVFFV